MKKSPRDGDQPFRRSSMQMNDKEIARLTLLELIEAAKRLLEEIELRAMRAEGEET